MNEDIQRKVQIVKILFKKHCHRRRRILLQISIINCN